MNTEAPRRRVLRPWSLVLAGALLSVATACGRGAGAAAAPADSLALRLALAPPFGDSELDARIRAAQATVRERPELPRLERLATLFINKARATGDPGHYKQAEACADAIVTVGGDGFAADLIRGHVRHALHDFAAAEEIARRLVDGRGMFLDHGLLGDVMLDLGRLDEARAAYQRMLDLRPGLQSYARAAELRWLAGDVAGCRELLVNAASAGSRRDPESMAWVLARRAALELCAEDAEAALRYADEALTFAAEHPAALVVRGRAALALGRHGEAVESLAAAAARYPLPAHLWGHADALRAAGRAAEAAAVEMRLVRTGAREDPRTFALWLATRGDDRELALRLAEQECSLRQDAHTLDVLALARLRAGDLAGAREAMQRALAVGVDEPRFRLHAALIAEAGSDLAGAASHAAVLRGRSAALWPTERRELERLTARL